MDDGSYRGLGIRLLHPDARLPSQSPGDVGFDLYSVENTEFIQQGRISTGLAIARWPSLAEDATLFAKIEGRSSLAAQGLFPVGGIIDPSYRGEIIVVLMGIDCHRRHSIKRGDRVAQLIVYQALTTDSGLILYETLDEDPSGRGTKGFGSTGR